MFQKTIIRSLFTAASFGLAVNATKAQDFTPDATLKPGMSAPGIVTAKWIKGEEVKSFEKGKVYVIEFWATWCGPCRGAMPHLSEVANKYKGKATIFSINTNELAYSKNKNADYIAKAEHFVERLGDGMDYAVGIDTRDTTMWSTWIKPTGFEGIPKAYIIGRDQKIAWIGHPAAVEEPLELIVNNKFDAAGQKQLAGDYNKVSEKYRAVFKPFRKLWDDREYLKMLPYLDTLQSIRPGLADFFDGVRFEIYSRKNPELAGHLGEQYLKKYHNAPLTLMGMASFALDSGSAVNYPLALKMAEQVAARSETTDRSALSLLAKAWFKNGDAKKAIALQEAAIKSMEQNQFLDIKPEMIEPSRKLLEEYKSQANTAAGIRFSSGSWKEIQELAKKEKKAIFIDVYTSWCGPCKKMADEVFPQQQVGNVFNANFINYKIDAEKGEGIGLSNKYNAKAYPTYLFINSDGELIYRTTGYMPAEAFIKEANIAITEKNDPKPLAKWMDEYKAGNRSKDFLLGYLKKRQATELPCGELIEELFPKLNAADLQEKETWAKLLASYIAVQYIPGGYLYKYVIQHYAAIDSIGASRAPSLYIMQFGVNNYILKNIVPNKKEQELSKAEACMKQLATLLKSPDKEAVYRKVKLDYYAKNYDAKKFNTAVTDYVENGLFKRDPNQMIAENKPKFDKYMEPYLSGKADSTKVDNWAMLKDIFRLGDAVSWAYFLRDAAEAIYLNSTDKAILQRGLTWAKKSRDIFSHFSTEGVYAGLLFKNGKQNEAVKIYEQELAKVPSLKTKLFAENTATLKAGKAPKNLWK